MAYLQAYTFVESLEREVFDERYSVYLYVVDLRAELDERTPLHSCICCGDVLCQAPHNACRCICRAIQGFPKGVSYQ